MSNSVFPIDLPGLKLNISRRPLYSTKVQSAASGKELRARWWQTPRFKYKLSYEFLRRDVNGDEAKTLRDFFMTHAGKWDSFILPDPYDGIVTAQSFGTGTGAQTAFQLIDTFGYSCGGISPTLYVSDWEGNEKQYSVARTNYTWYSEAINSWSKTRTLSTTDAITAPDGTTTADKLYEDTSATTTHYSSQSSGLTTVPDNSTAIFSLWAKLGERTIFQLRVTNRANQQPAVEFDLNAGTATVRTSTALLGQGIEAYGNGWYRCWIAANVSSGATSLNAIAYLCSAANTITYTGDGVSGLYLWGRQFEVLPAGEPIGPTNYIKTPAAAAVTVTDYTITADGAITFANAPLSGAALTWTGQVARRVRFDSDDVDFTQLYSRIWEIKSIDLISVK